MKITYFISGILAFAFICFNNPAKSGSRSVEGQISLALTPTNVIVYGISNGSIDLLVTGGTPPYQYQWSNGADTEDIRNLSPGLYSVIVTDANSQTKTASIQIEKYELVKLHYSNSSGEKGLTTFKFDKTGLMYQANWGLLNGKRSSVNYYTYNNKGLMIIKYREFSDSMTSTQTFDYDTNGNLTSENFESTDGRKGLTTFEYDENGFLTKANCEKYSGWYDGIIKYEYNSGRLVKAILQQSGQEVGVIEYIYDSTGNLNKEYWEFSNSWNQTFTYECKKFEIPDHKSYTSSNVFITNTYSYRLTKEDYNYSNQARGPSYYTYDNEGKLIEKVFERSDGFMTKTTFEYNDDGILTKSFRNYSNGLQATFSYEFNGNRRLTKRIYNRSDGISGAEYYEYNNKMQLSRAEYENFDNWLTGTITFSYESNGRLSSGYFQGKDFNSNISFQYDQIDNIIEIHWDLSFGGFQTYTFEYQEI